MEKGRGLYVKLEFSLIKQIIFVLNNPWTRSMSCGPRPAMVHSGSAMDGSTELTGAWPPAAPCPRAPAKGQERGSGTRGIR
jgi:hypothetical protein